MTHVHVALVSVVHAWHVVVHVAVIHVRVVHGTVVDEVELGIEGEGGKSWCPEGGWQLLYWREAFDVASARTVACRATTWGTTGR